MIRYCCAACARAINRTDHLFESSDGTLCRECLARLAAGHASPQVISVNHSLIPPSRLGNLPTFAALEFKHG